MLSIKEHDQQLSELWDSMIPARPDSQLSDLMDAYPVTRDLLAAHQILRHRAKRDGVMLPTLMRCRHCGKRANVRFKARTGTSLWTRRVHPYRVYCSNECSSASKSREQTHKNVIARRPVKPKTCWRCKHIERGVCTLGHDVEPARKIDGHTILIKPVGSCPNAKIAQTH